MLLEGLAVMALLTIRIRQEVEVAERCDWWDHESLERERYRLRGEWGREVRHLVGLVTGTEGLVGCALTHTKMTLVAAFLRPSPKVSSRSLFQQLGRERS